MKKSASVSTIVLMILALMGVVFAGVALYHQIPAQETNNEQVYPGPLNNGYPGWSNKVKPF